MSRRSFLFRREGIAIFVVTFDLAKDYYSNCFGRRAELTVEEMSAAATWTSHIPDSGEAINAALRKGKKLTKEQNEEFVLVQKAIAKSYTKKSIVLYRCVGPEVFSRIREGDTFVDHGIMEASFSPEINNLFMHPKGYYLKIEVPRDTTCLYITPLNERISEQGVLFPADTICLITSVKKRPLFSYIETKIECSIITA